MKLTKSILKQLIKEELKYILHENVLPAPGESHKRKRTAAGKIDYGDAGGRSHEGPQKWSTGFNCSRGVVGAPEGSQAYAKYGYNRSSGAGIAMVPGGKRRLDLIDARAPENWKEYSTKYPELKTGKVVGIAGSEKNLKWLQDALDNYAAAVKFEFKWRRKLIDRAHEYRWTEKGPVAERTPGHLKRTSLSGKQLSPKEQALERMKDGCEALNDAQFKTDRAFTKYIRRRSMFAKSKRTRGGPGFPLPPKGVNLQQEPTRRLVKPEGMTELGWFYRLLKKFRIKQPDHLTKHGEDFMWGPEHQTAYKELKKRMKAAGETPPDLAKLQGSVLNVLKPYR